MLAEEPKVVQVRKKHDYTTGGAEHHLSTDSKGLLCDRDMEGREARTSYGVKDSEVCPDCLGASLASAVKLAGLAKRLEAIVAELRRDGLSLFDYGNIPKAIGQANKAAYALMEEARERALHEQLRSIEEVEN